jgi:hypothetical protein
MNKLEKHIFNAHRIYFVAMFLERRFSLERRLEFSDKTHREMLMYGAAGNGIVAWYPPACFGIAP